MHFVRGKRCLPGSQLVPGAVKEDLSNPPDTEGMVMESCFDEGQGKLSITAPKEEGFKMKTNQDRNIAIVSIGVGGLFFPKVSLTWQGH